MSSVSMQNLTLNLFIEGHPLTAKVPDRGSFLAFFFTLNADYIAWKLLKMALEVEYIMDFYHPAYWLQIFI